MKKHLIIIGILSFIIGIFGIIDGSVKISLEDIKNIIFNYDQVEEHIKTIILDIRVPRVLMALLVGMMLASSGSVVQTVFQNPLADPYIIGISASATFGAVLAFLLELPDFYYGLFAFISAVISSTIIFKLGKTGNKTNVTALLIIGIAVSALLGSFIAIAFYFIGEDSYKITMWTMGYLGAATWKKIILLIIPLILSVIYFFIHRHHLDGLLSGDEEAHSLGIDVAKLKKHMLIVSCLVVAFSVSFSGMIGFVGLIIPHIIRMVVGSSNSKIIPLATLSGGLFLLLCDTIGKSVMAPMEIPVGIITSITGAPFFLYLAFKARKGEF